jgi:glycosyltransferase involved in cell wall biosynthesis
VHWKGIQYIIPAFEKLLTIYPNAKLLLANAQGDYKSELQKLLQKIPSDNYIEIPFEANISALYHLFDVYVHTPIDAQLEAFGQTYVEALAAGTPSIFTLSGVASEFIEHEKNALVVPFQNSEAIFEAMEKILKDEKLKNQLKINGFSSIQHKFNLEHFIQKLEKLYK